MIFRLLIVLTALLATAAQAKSPGDGMVYITGVTVVHPEREGAAALEPDASVVIRDGRIEAVLRNVTFELPQGATVINGNGKYLIPGIVDAHVHFFQSGNLYTRPDVIDLNAVVPYAEETARNKARLDATFTVWLASGVTGVVDIGGPFWNFDVRDRMLGNDLAPRMAVAGPLISMVERPQLDLGDPPIIRIDSIDDGLALVKRELERDPDYIKVWFIHRERDSLIAQEAIVKAAGDAAHAAGKKLAVHATELLVAKAALRAGADFLVHSVFDQPIDDEFLALAKARKVVYCPTLFVTMGYPLALSNLWRATPEEAVRADPEILAAMDDLNEIPPEKLPERFVEHLKNAKPPALPAIAMQNLRKVLDAGITVVMGTDAGNIGTLHGPSILREMRLMQDAGLTPLEVLRASTSSGAQLLGLQGKTGVIAPGMLADLVLLDADPLADAGNVGKIYRVIKNGVVYEPEKLMEAIR
ncbi:MAG: amidohydrolase family protein [Steroidobacteraceae bacterium]